MEMALFRSARKEDLATKLERKGSELSQTAAERGAETSRRISDILRRASDDIKSVDVRGAMDTARVKAEDTADMARDRVRSAPLTSVAVAMGVGILAGAAIGMVGGMLAGKYRYES